jgi:hypothetical protein
MTALFTEQDYATLAGIVFRPDYPGNATARGVVEAPGGVPTQLDTGKRYAHVALKYIAQCPHNTDTGTLVVFLVEAWSRAVQVAAQLRLPVEFQPSFEHRALRVLEYPAGIGGHYHTDFDLFTLACYRNLPDQFRYGNGPHNRRFPQVRATNPGLHIGELVDEICQTEPGRTPLADPHYILPHPTQVQRSIVYFAVPDHAAVLPSGQTVGGWLEERKNRSRYAATEAT